MPDYSVDHNRSRDKNIIDSPRAAETCARLREEISKIWKYFTKVLDSEFSSSLASRSILSLMMSLYITRYVEV